MNTKPKTMNKEDLEKIYASKDPTDLPNQGLLLKGVVIATAFSLAVYLIGYIALVKFIG